MKVTKKQRKQQTRNAMVQRSMDRGQKIMIGGVEYRGRPKTLAQSGMPYVRHYD